MLDIDESNYDTILIPLAAMLFIIFLINLSIG